jgi:hypothetical protein
MYVNSSYIGDLKGNSAGTKIRTLNDPFLYGSDRGNKYLYMQNDPKSLSLVLNCHNESTTEHQDVFSIYLFRSLIVSNVYNPALIENKIFKQLRVKIRYDPISTSLFVATGYIK